MSEVIKNDDKNPEEIASVEVKGSAEEEKNATVTEDIIDLDEKQHVRPKGKNCCVENDGEQCGNDFLQHQMYMPINAAGAEWKKRIMIAVPTTGNLRIEWTLARFGQVIPCNWSNSDVFQFFDQFSPLGYLVADARNICIEHFIKQGHEWLCFKGETEVETIDGAKFIKDIKKGELVKTHKGRYRKVNEIMKRPYKQRQPLIHVYTENSVIKSTLNHPYLIIKDKKTQWIEAKNLTSKDKLVYPINKTEKDFVKFDCFSNSIGENGKAVKKSKKNKIHYDKIEITTDFARFMGLYLAEGHSEYTGIGFTFNNKEKEYIDFITNVIKKIFNRKATIYSRWATTVKLNIISIGKKFSEFFGENARVKRIPDFVFDWSLKNRLSFIKGYLEGDGSFNPGVTFNSASKDLIDGLEKLCKTSGINCKIYGFIQPPESKMKDGNIIKNTGAYYGYISKQSYNKILDIVDSKTKDDYYIIPIKEVKNKKMAGNLNDYNVYNLSVLEDNSYIAQGVAVHNCFIDHDVILPPDTFLKINDYMRTAEFPVVSGLYFCKGSHPEPLIFRGRGNSYYDDWKKGDKVMVDGIPMGCFPKDTKIQTMKGWESIQDIKRGSFVLTHKGQYREVYEETIRDYKGKMIKINNKKFNLDVEITEEHPILAAEGSYLSNGMLRKPTSAFRNYRKYEPEFIEAGKITEKHILLYPINQQVLNYDTIFIDNYLDDLSIKNDLVAYENKNKIQTKWIKNEIRVTKELLRLFGYYISEGSSSNCNLKFSFNSKETEYIEDVQNCIKSIFDLGSNLDLSNLENNGISVVVCSKVLSDLFAKLFGKGAHKKHIYASLMTLPINKQIELLKGLFNGDGYISTKSRNRLGYTTVSQELALNVRDLLLRQGIISSIRKSKYTDRETYRYDITISGEDANKLRILFGLEPITNTVNQGSLAWIDDGYVWLPIHSLDSYDYEGQVFNLSIEDDESYCTTNFAVHNCTLIHRSLLEVMYNESEIYTAGTTQGPVVVRKVFETPRSAWYDPENLRYETRIGTEDLHWCERVMKTDVFKRCGVEKYKKFQDMEFPFLLDTGIFCQHIDQNGVMYPANIGVFG